MSAAKWQYTLYATIWTIEWSLHFLIQFNLFFLAFIVLHDFDSLLLNEMTFLNVELFLCLPSTTWNHYAHKKIPNIATDGIATIMAEGHSLALTSIRHVTTFRPHSALRRSYFIKSHTNRASFKVNMWPRGWKWFTTPKCYNMCIMHSFQWRK